MRVGHNQGGPARWPAQVRASAVLANGPESRRIVGDDPNVVRARTKRDGHRVVILGRRRADNPLRELAFGIGSTGSLTVIHFSTARTVRKERRPRVGDGQVGTLGCGECSSCDRQVWLLD